MLQFSFDPNSRANPNDLRGVELAAHRQRFRQELSDLKSRVGQALAILGPSAGEETDRMLNELASKYEDALAGMHSRSASTCVHTVCSASHQPDPILEERRRALNDTVRALDEKMSQVQTNSAAVQEAIYQKMEEALFQLQDETERRLSQLQTEKLELQRQLHQMQWTEAFVRVLQERLPPVSFVSAWSRHADLRNHICSRGWQRLFSLARIRI